MPQPLFTLFLQFLCQNLVVAVRMIAAWWIPDSPELILDTRRVKSTETPKSAQAKKPSIFTHLLSKLFKVTIQFSYLSVPFVILEA
jgi:hypothetical protein